MKRKILYLFLIAFTILLTGCGKSSAFDEILNAGYNIRVVFDANGGRFDNDTQRFSYVKSGSYICEPGENSTILSKVSRDGYTLIGWFVVENVDEDGNPIKDDKDNVIFTDKAWDFNNDIVTENLTLCAKWEVNYRFILRYVYENPVTKELILDEDNSKIEVLNDDYHIGGVFGTTDKLQLKNTTYIGLYKDQECTEEITIDYTHNLNPESPTETIYVKCYEGKFTLATSAEDFAKMTSSSNYILLNDIDFTGVDFNIKSYSGTIIGNGFTIKNINKKYNDSNISLNSFGLFGQMNNATLLDVNFENCNITLEFNNNPVRPDVQNSLGFFAGDINNSNIKNIELNNCSLILKKAESITNIFIEAIEENNYYYENLENSTFENVSGTIEYVETTQVEE